MIASAIIIVLRKFFNLFVCMRVINDYICKLARMVLPFEVPKIEKKHQLLKLF